MNTDERFDSHVTPCGDCLNWTGAVTQAGPRCAGGYGQFKVTLEGRHITAYAHRYAYERQNGVIPKGSQVRHKCHNRLCVNPDHLCLGSLQDNMDDMKAAGRQSKGKHRPAAKLTDAKVLEIRRRYASGERCCDLEKSYCVSHCTMWQVIHRRSWKHI